MPKRYLGALPDAVWQPLLTHYLAEADGFVVHMPDGDGPFAAGRADIESLPGVTTRPWDGMRDAVEMSGPLSPEAVALITACEDSLVDRSDRALWDFQLHAGPRELLYIGDFSDLLVDEPDAEILRRLGVEVEVEVEVDEQDEPG